MNFSPTKITCTTIKHHENVGYVLKNDTVCILNGHFGHIFYDIVGRECTLQLNDSECDTQQKLQVQGLIHYVARLVSTLLTRSKLQVLTHSTVKSNLQP